MPYISANGVETYYEVRGEGEPLLLLHGGTGTNEDFAQQVAVFAEQYRVIAPERRGHGRTADVEGPITYEVMRDDTIAFMEALGIERAAMVGWSDGANVALMVAMARPERVRKIVAVGGNFRSDGLVEGFRGWISTVTPETFPAKYREAYDRLSRDGPAHFGVVLEKVHRMWLSEPQLTADDLRRVAAPVLVMVGDRDLIRLEHTVEMFEGLPHAQLAIVPGSTHEVLQEKPELANRMILEFLADD